MSVRLPIHVGSVGVARALLRKTLSDVGTRATRAAPDSALADDAALMLSELVINAVRHSHSLLWLDIHITGHTLHVAVADDTPDLPVLRHPDTDATHGRGIQIVDTLADRWGATRSRDRKTVWFELTLLPATDHDGGHYTEVHPSEDSHLDH